MGDNSWQEPYPLNSISGSSKDVVMDSLSPFGNKENNFTRKQLRPQSTRSSIYPEPVDNIEGKSVLEVWLDFCTRTTIVGLDHILTRSNNWWRFLWSLILIWGCGMSVYQSLDIIYQFYDNNGIQRIQFRINNSLRLPSVTICNNIFVDYEINDVIPDPQLVKLLDKFTDLIESNTTFEDSKSEALKQVILKHIGKLDAPKLRQVTGSVPHGIDKFFFECFIGNQYCDYQNPDDVFIFFHLAYGTCFTINPGFRKTYQADENTGIQFSISLDGLNRVQYINRNYAVMLIHEAGTAPILYNSELVTLKDEKAIKIILTLREHNRRHTCVDGTNKDARHFLLHYTELSPYIYSAESCVASCAILWNIRRESRLIEPNTWIMRDERFGNWTRHHLCVPPDCFPRSSTAGERMCDAVCLPRCRETIIGTKFVKLLKENKELEFDKRRFNNSDTTIRWTKLKRHIYIGYQTPMYEITSEEAKYSAADFWGIVGGNVSLWIGICLISLVELVELVMLLIQAWLMNRKNSNVKKSNSVKNSVASNQVEPTRALDVRNYHFAN